MMDTTAPMVSLRFRLAAPDPAVSVDVRLSDYGDRWVAVAETTNRREVGLGQSARAALGASLSPLGARAAIALLVDLNLLAVSLEVL